MGEQSINIALQSNIIINKEPFYAVMSYENKDLHIAARWKNINHHEFGINDISKHFSITLPTFLTWQIIFEEIMLDYKKNQNMICLYTSTEDNKNLILAANLNAGVYSCHMDLNFSYKLHTLPIVGKYMNEKDCLGISYIQANYSKNGFDMQYKILCNLAGIEIDFQDTDTIEPKTFIETAPLNPQPIEKKSSVHWMILNKTIGPCYIRRIGGEFKDGKISILIDAGIKISIIQIDFLELYIRMALNKGFTFDYGLKGLVISLHKPPLSITGGLYTVKPGELYNGTVAICYNKFSFLALGSYGIIKETNDSSVFIYMLLDYPFGGPPCFYITGIAAGFGVNRKINLPTLDKVPEFPFIQMACGEKVKGEKITPDTSPATVLSKLSDEIEPSSGSNFITAGIRFTTFGMLETVMVANFEFGTRVELSLLGISTMSLPPQSPSPIAYGRLALRAIYCPNDGILEIEGALCDDAYIFSHECHLNGGFAFYSWFKGEHAGDFVLSVGGYHPEYDRKHYPAVERVRINWTIMKGLTLQGEAYFALTPNCIMAGGVLNLDYTWGKLKAWCHALANFIIAWKPFHYDIEIGVNIGVSYRLDFLFIHHTFKIELGANLHLWGPEFAGIVHINWCIISFTIKFNTKAEQKYEKLTWEQFTNEFLPDFSKGIETYHETGQKLAQLQIALGKISEKNLLFPTRTKVCKVCYVNMNEFQFDIHSALPLSKINIGKQQIENDNKVGIIPMKVKDIDVEIVIECCQLVDKKGQSEKVNVKLNAIPVLQNLPKALWGTNDPDMSEDMLKNIVMGCSLKGNYEKGVTIPMNQNSYSLSQLSKNEEYHCKIHYKWTPVIDVTTPSEYTLQIGESMKKNNIRRKWLNQLRNYGVRQEHEISMDNFVKHQDKLLQCPFVLRKTSAKVEKI